MTRAYVPPRNSVEEELCALYADILEISIHEVGIEHNFFELGGNSVRAIRLANRISKALDIHLPIAEILQSKTVSQLSEAIKSITLKNIEIPIVEVKEHYPLSFAQERLWFIERYEEGTSVYHIPMVLALSETASYEALHQAIQAIVMRHEVLRTVFSQDDQSVDVQIICEIPLEIHTKHYATEAAYLAQVTADIHRPFDLTQEYPIRVCFYELNVNEKLTRYLLVNIHHVSSDGWSMDIFLKELWAYYTQYHTGEALVLPALPIQYKDFAVWQRGYLSGEHLTEQLSYWKNRLSGYETLYLPTDYPRPAQVSYEGAQVSFNLNEALSTKLRSLAREKGYTLYTVLLAGFYVLLNKYSGQEDIIVGSVTANRHYEPIRDLIGFFVNMWVQREQLILDQPMTQLMKQIHQHLIEAQRYQDLPFEKLVQEAVFERDMSRHPLFQVLFTVQSFGGKTEELSTFLKPVIQDNLHAITRFDLECFIDDSAEMLTGHFSYATRLFDVTTIKRLICHYEYILEQMVEDSEKSLQNYQVLTSAEYQKLVYNWNKTEKESAIPGELETPRFS